MFEGLLERILLGIFGDYIEEFNREKLSLSIWKGEIELLNLKLKSNALEKLELPINVIYGEINKLTIKIPWTKINSQPVVINLYGLNCIAIPNTNNNTQYNINYTQLLKKRLLEEYESNKISSNSSVPVTGKSYSERTINSIIANLQLNIENIHIRYEDSITIPDRILLIFNNV